MFALVCAKFLNWLPPVWLCVAEFLLLICPTPLGLKPKHPRISKSILFSELPVSFIELFPLISPGKNSSPSYFCNAIGFGYAHPDEVCGIA